jgi:hypothetical protein
LQPAVGTTYRLDRFCNRHYAQGDAMDDDTPPTDRANEYRNSAEEMRLLAQQMRFSDNRDRLLTLADSFNKLADQVEELGIRQPRARQTNKQVW